MTRWFISRVRVCWRPGAGAGHTGGDTDSGDTFEDLLQACSKCKLYIGNSTMAKRNMPNLKNSVSSSVAQHPVLFKYLASYLHRPVPELRLCAGTLRITRSQRPALGHQGIEGGDTQEVEEVKEEVERGGLAADWPHGAMLPLLLSPSSLNCSASGDQSRAVIIVPVIMSRAMSALGLHITPTLSQQGLMVHGLLVYGWVNKAIIANSHV